MSATIAIDDLKLGMFVHLDLGWWAHPFALSSFMITSADQIQTLRGLGLKQLRWSPEKSRALEPASPGLAETEDAIEGPDGPASGPADAGNEHTGASQRPAALASVVNPRMAAVQASPSPQALAQRRAQLAAQRQAEQRCAAQLSEARTGWLEASQQLADAPHAARALVEDLTQAVLGKLMGEQSVAMRVLADAGGEPAAAHALNVMVLSLMMGRVCGLAAADMHQLGLGALLHDIGKLNLPERVRRADAALDGAELAQYKSHVALGVAQGQRMGLDAAALAVLAQHHELADGSGFPQGLQLADTSMAARIVALVNQYDNLCNPRLPGQALTPHDALALLFAQGRKRHDLTVLNAFIRMMGVYPPGSLVQLTNNRYAAVVSVNAARPLKPRVLVCDLQVPADEALLLDLDGQTDLGIRRSIKPQQLPSAVHDYLAPQARMVYFFEPMATAAQHSCEAVTP